MCVSYVFLLSDGSSIVSSVWMTCDRSWLASLANPSSTCSVGYVGLIPVVKVQSTARWVSCFQPCFWMLGYWCIAQSYMKSSVQAFHRTYIQLEIAAKLMGLIVIYGRSMEVRLQMLHHYTKGNPDFWETFRSSVSSSTGVPNIQWHLPCGKMNPWVLGGNCHENYEAEPACQWQNPWH